MQKKKRRMGIPPSTIFGLKAAVYKRAIATRSGQRRSLNDGFPYTPLNPNHERNQKFCLDVDEINLYADTAN